MIAYRRAVSDLSHLRIIVRVSANPSVQRRRKAQSAATDCSPSTIFLESDRQCLFNGKIDLTEFPRIKVDLAHVHHLDAPAVVVVRVEFQTPKVRGDSRLRYIGFQLSFMYSDCRSSWNVELVKYVKGFEHGLTASLHRKKGLRLDNGQDKARRRRKIARYAREPKSLPELLEFEIFQFYRRHIELVNRVCALFLPILNDLIGEVLEFHLIFQRASQPLAIKGV